MSAATTLAKLPAPELPVQSPPSEWEALLTATASPSELDPKQFANLDWQRFLSAAEYHGVAAVVAQTLLDSSLRSRLPVGIEKRLREIYQSILMRSFPLVQEIQSITAAFSAQAIPIIPYKGPALAERYWGSFVLRDCVDLDFLVQPDDVERAGEILEGLGYERVAAVPQHLRPALVRNASEEQFRHRATGLLLELQWAPSPRVFALRFDTARMWSNVSNIEFAGEEVLSPSAEDLLTLLCIHGWKHNWSRLIWVGDVSRLLAAESIDWDRLVYRSKSDRTLGVLLLGLHLASRLFGSSAPASVSFGSETVRLSESLTSRLKSAQTCSYLDWHRYMLAARDSRADRLQQMASFIFTPGLGEYSVYNLPPWATSGYRLVRLARVLQLLPGKAAQ